MIYFYNLWLIYKRKYCIVLCIGNENKQMWFASPKELRRMIEIQMLITTIYILYYFLIEVTIITFALIIALVAIISKQI